MAEANSPRENVRALQRGLYVAAKRNGKRKFPALLDRIARPDVLLHAWEQVRSNRGSAGIDGETLQAVVAYGVERMLEELRELLTAGRYRPQPPRRVYIPKPGRPGEERPLSIPRVRIGWLRPPPSWCSNRSFAVAHFRVHYRGKEAHASAYPERGVNAADALTVAQVAIGLLRQHLQSHDQVHGIVIKGGDAPNIVPAHTTARYYVRARDMESLEHLQIRVDRCFQAGALATGTRLEQEPESPPYSEFRADREIGELYRRNAEALGRTFPALPPKKGGSTDMANVSLRMPAIHPMIHVDARGCEQPRAGVHRRVRHGVGRPGGARRRARDGDDRRRPGRDRGPPRPAAGRRHRALPAAGLRRGRRAVLPRLPRWHRAQDRIVTRSSAEGSWSSREHRAPGSSCRRPGRSASCRTPRSGPRSRAS
jgi:hypothetical protein